MHAQEMLANSACSVGKQCVECGSAQCTLERIRAVGHAIEKGLGSRSAACCSNYKTGWGAQASSTLWDWDRHGLEPRRKRAQARQVGRAAGEARRRSAGARSKGVSPRGAAATLAAARDAPAAAARPARPPPRCSAAAAALRRTPQAASARHRCCTPRRRSGSGAPGLEGSKDRRGQAGPTAQQGRWGWGQA